MIQNTLDFDQVALKISESISYLYKNKYFNWIAETFFENRIFFDNTISLCIDTDRCDLRLHHCEDIDDDDDDGDDDDDRPGRGRRRDNGFKCVPLGKFSYKCVCKEGLVFDKDDDDEDDDGKGKCRKDRTGE